MIGDLQTGREAIFDALAANTSLTALIGGDTNPRIYQEIAEQMTADEVEDDKFPLVLIQLVVAPRDATTASRDRIQANAIFRVIGCLNRRSFSGLQAIAGYIDTALDKQTFVASGQRVLSSARLNPWQRLVVDNGKTYAMSGGDYELLIR